MKRAVMPALVLPGSLPVFADAAERSDGRVYELGTYHLNHGKLDAFLPRFRTLNDPLLPKHGLMIVDCWTPPGESDHKGDKFIYLLSFPGRNAAKAARAALKADPG